MTDKYAPGHTPPSRVEEWGFPGHLTTLENERLQEFRSALRAMDDAEGRAMARWSDAQLLRFMRARDFQVKKAVKMVADMLDWLRTEGRYRRLKVSDFPTVMKFQLDGLVRLVGKEKGGRPVVRLMLGKFFPKQVHDAAEVQAVFVFYMTSLVQYTNKLGFTEFCAIADLSEWRLNVNFSLAISRMLADALQCDEASPRSPRRRLTRASQVQLRARPRRPSRSPRTDPAPHARAQPETLLYAFVVHNPWAFSAAWSMLSPFVRRSDPAPRPRARLTPPQLEERVKAKIHVWGDKVEKLLEYIDADVLETRYGGTHEPYPVPDDFTRPLVEGKTLVTGRYGGIVEDGTATRDFDLPLWGLSDADTGAGPAAHEADDHPDTRHSRRVPGPGAAPAPGGASTSSNGGASPAPRPPLVRQVSRTQKIRARLGAAFSGRLRRQTSADLEEPIRGPAAPLSPTTSGALHRPMEVVPPKPRPRVTVFGATGRTGRLAVLKALEQGCDVTVFVRVSGTHPVPPDLMARADASGGATGPSLQIVVGEIDNAIDMERALEGSDAVVSAIGVPPSLSGHAAEFLPGAVASMLDAMERNSVRRFVMASDAHASTAWWDAGAGVAFNVGKEMYWPTHNQFVAQAEDAVRQRAVKGGIDFTFVRPGALTDEAAPGAVLRSQEGFVLEDGPGELARSELAALLVKLALDKSGDSFGVGLAATSKP